MAKVKLTKRYVEKLPFEQVGQKIYWDTELRGFGLKIGKQKKTYIAQKDIRGKSVRVSIGDHTLYPAEAARDIAREELLEMSKGINPNKERQNEILIRVNLEDLFEDYIDARVGRIKVRTLEGYKDLIKNHFGDWAKKNLKEIDRGMIVARHQYIATKAGPYAAKNAMVLLGMLYKFAIIDDEKLTNPVEILSAKKLLAPAKRRSTLIMRWRAGTGR